MNHPNYGRGFSTPRERVFEALVWLLCGFVLMALFVTGLWYIWPENGVPPATTDSVTRPVLEETPLPIQFSTVPVPKAVFTINSHCAILFASGIRISETGKVTIPPGVDVDASTRQFWDSIERTCPRWQGSKVEEPAK